MAHITKTRGTFYRYILECKKKKVQEVMAQFRGWGRVAMAAAHLGITTQTIHNILKEAKREGI